MAMLTLYPAKINSPSTTLSASIDIDDTTISVYELSCFPSGANEAVLGDGDDAETILYSGISGASGPGTITVTQRGFQGTAKEWPADTQIARKFTAYDYDAVVNNLNLHDHTGGASGVQLHHGGLSGLTDDDHPQYGISNISFSGTMINSIVRPGIYQGTGSVAPYCPTDSFNNLYCSLIVLDAGFGLTTQIIYCTTSPLGIWARDGLTEGPTWGDWYEQGCPPASVNPSALGTASPGSGIFASRYDHVHTLPKLDDLAVPDDNTDLNASAASHGLLPKLSGDESQFLNGSGDWAIPDNYTEIFESSTDSVVLPVDPVVGHRFEFVGTGTDWTVSATSGTYIRDLDELVTSISSSTPSHYDSVSLIYAGIIDTYPTWIVYSRDLYYTELFEEDTGTLTLPSSPNVGQVYEIVGTGTAWTVNIPSSTYVRMLDVLVSTSVAGSTGYECATFIYAGTISTYDTWIIKNAVGELTLT